MEKIISILILGVMCINLNAQKVVYDKDNKKDYYLKEDFDLKFLKTEICFPQKEDVENASLLGLVPSAVDVGFKLVSNIIESRQKKYSSEYSVQKCYMDAGSKSIPDIVIERKVFIDGAYKNAIYIKMKAKKLDNLDGFFYYVDSINLEYSKAKTTRSSKMFDYTIEVKPTFFVEIKDAGFQKKSQESYPIVIHSVEFGNNKMPEYKYRTDIIPMPKGGMFAELAVKIVETNPAKVEVDKLLEVYSNYKDEAKTIINNYIESFTTEASDTVENTNLDEVVGNK